MSASNNKSFAGVWVCLALALSLLAGVAVHSDQVEESRDLIWNLDEDLDATEIHWSYRDVVSLDFFFGNSGHDFHIPTYFRLEYDDANCQLGDTSLWLHFYLEPYDGPGLEYDMQAGLMFELDYSISSWGLKLGYDFERNFAPPLGISDGEEFTEAVAEVFHKKRHCIGGIGLGLYADVSLTGATIEFPLKIVEPEDTMWVFFADPDSSEHTLTFTDVTQKDSVRLSVNPLFSGTIEIELEIEPEDIPDYSILLSIGKLEPGLNLQWHKPPWKCPIWPPLDFCNCYYEDTFRFAYGDWGGAAEYIDIPIDTSESDEPRFEIAWDSVPGEIHEAQDLIVDLIRQAADQFPIPNEADTLIAVISNLYDSLNVGYESITVEYSLAASETPVVIGENVIDASDIRLSNFNNRDDSLIVDTFIFNPHNPEYIFGDDQSWENLAVHPRYQVKINPSLVPPKRNGSWPPVRESTVQTVDCCIGDVGDVDLVGNCTPAEQNTDISDLTNLIDHLFINYPAICCPEEADIAPAISGGVPDGAVDISDLTGVIDHLFINYPPMPNCPSSSSWYFACLRDSSSNDMASVGIERPLPDYAIRGVWTNALSHPSLGDTILCSLRVENRGIRWPYDSVWTDPEDSVFVRCSTSYERQQLTPYTIHVVETMVDNKLPIALLEQGSEDTLVFEHVISENTDLRQFMPLHIRLHFDVNAADSLGERPAWEPSFDNNSAVLDFILANDPDLALPSDSFPLSSSWIDRDLSEIIFLAAPPQSRFLFVSDSSFTYSPPNVTPTDLLVWLGNGPVPTSYTGVSSDTSSPEDTTWSWIPCGFIGDFTDDDGVQYKVYGGDGQLLELDDGLDPDSGYCFRACFVSPEPGFESSFVYIDKAGASVLDSVEFLYYRDAAGVLHWDALPGAPQDTVTLYLPEDSAAIQADTPTIFNWFSVSSATEYEISFDEGAEIYIVPTTYYEWSTSVLGSHVWKVRGRNSSGNGPWSPEREFTVE